MMEKRTPASWIPIPISAPTVKKAKPESSQATLNLRKYPKPMREKVIKAIENMERWLKFDERDVDWKTSLDDFRANRSSGITNPSFVMTFQGDTRVLEALYLLDKAFEELHSYRPEDHLTQGVVSAVASFTKMGKINDETQRAKDYLRKVNYLDAPAGPATTHGTKGFHRAQAQKLVSTGTVQKITAELKAERMESQNRTEK